MLWARAAMHWSSLLKQPSINCRWRRIVLDECTPRTEDETREPYGAKEEDTLKAGDVTAYTTVLPSILKGRILGLPTGDKANGIRTRALHSAIIILTCPRTSCRRRTRNMGRRNIGEHTVGYAPCSSANTSRDQRYTQ